MAGLVCLTIALVCAIIARILLFIAALNISAWWALGVFLPFGPLLFRLSYPDEARKSYIFRLGTLLGVFLYFVVGSGTAMPTLHRKLFVDTPKEQDYPAAVDTPKQKGYAAEFIANIARHIPWHSKPADTRTVEERSAANDREFERLNRWYASLQKRKRDLLRSDVAGNEAYNIDLREYMDALAAANAEKQALGTADAK